MGRSFRVAATIAWLVATETAVVAVAALPVLLGWHALTALDARTIVVVALVALAIVPGLLVFALLLLAGTAAACRVNRWRTPEDAELVIAALEWPLLRWVCYAAATHVAGFLAGSWLRASPVWTWYLRANGAEVGRGVFVNSTRLGDHNLLSFGDGVVIGSDVHLSGHTVEAGRVITGRVRVGRGAVIGVGAVVSIDVEIGDGAQVGALSFVPKRARLVPGRRYAGAPVRELGEQAPGDDAEEQPQTQHVGVPEEMRPHDAGP